MWTMSSRCELLQWFRIAWIYRWITKLHLKRYIVQHFNVYCVWRHCSTNSSYFGIRYIRGSNWLKTNETNASGTRCVKDTIEFRRQKTIKTMWSRIWRNASSQIWYIYTICKRVACDPSFNSQTSLQFPLICCTMFR